jgi:hypothetical protein
MQKAATMAHTSSMPPTAEPMEIPTIAPEVKTLLLLEVAEIRKEMEEEVGEGVEERDVWWEEII